MSDSINRPDEEQDYLEVSDDFESDMDVIDNDDFNEDDDGIFAPEENKKKKKSSLKLMLALILFAIIAGGAYFYSTLSNVQDAVPTPPLPQQADNTSPVVPQPVSDFENASGSEVAPPDNPDQQAGIILDQNTTPESLPQLPAPNQDNAGVSEANANTASDAPHISDGQETAKEAEGDETVTPPLADTTSTEPPSVPPEQTAQATAANKLPGPEPVTLPSADTTANHDLAPQAPPQTPVEMKNPKLEPPPEAEGLAVAPASKTSVPVQNANLQETPLPAAAPAAKKETKKAKENSANFYFDAPKGKALLDIPPPSIDPMREPGESIIIVRKPGQKNVSVKHAPTPDSSVVVEKSEDNQAIESRLVNANRASSLGMNDSALEFYNELYRKNSNDPRILMGRAVTLQKLGENQKAIDAYREVLQNDPDNAEATTNLMGLIAKSQPAVALENLLNMHQKYPRNADVTAQLGITYAQAGNPEDGLKYLYKAADLDPKNALHYYNIAVINEKLGKRAEAIGYYEKALDTYSIYGDDKNTSFSKEEIYDRLSSLRGN